MEPNSLTVNISLGRPSRRNLENLRFTDSQSKLSLFQNILYPVKEGIAGDAIDDPMIVGQGQVHHRPDPDFVLAFHLDRYRPLDHLAHPENSDLRLVDDRRSEQIAFAARIRHGKG